MLLERSELLIKEGLESDFAAAMGERGIPLLSGVPGVLSVQLGRGVENPGKFMLLVAWQSMQAHTAFRTLPVYPDFRQLFAPFSKGGSMEHFDMV
jgi:heme-degrading monooxygenase HmoA